MNVRSDSSSTVDRTTAALSGMWRWRLWRATGPDAGAGALGGSLN
jgi:hypothetical protein